MLEVSITAFEVCERGPTSRSRRRMTDQLDELTARHEELTELMALPETATSPGLLARYGRELARLEPIVAALRERDETARALPRPAPTRGPRPRGPGHGP